MGNLLRNDGPNISGRLPERRHRQPRRNERSILSEPNIRSRMDLGFLDLCASPANRLNAASSPADGADRRLRAALAFGETTQCVPGLVRLN
jgi:hypothetical protein